VPPTKAEVVRASPNFRRDAPSPEQKCPAERSRSDRAASGRACGGPTTALIGNGQGRPRPAGHLRSKAFGID